MVQLSLSALLLSCRTITTCYREKQTFFHSCGWWLLSSCNGQLQAYSGFPIFMALRVVFYNAKMFIVLTKEVSHSILLTLKDLNLSVKFIQIMTNHTCQAWKYPILQGFLHVHVVWSIIPQNHVHFLCWNVPCWERCVECGCQDSCRI